jgi:predicted enzyme related to lactoylglutathione lyase
MVRATDPLFLVDYVTRKKASYAMKMKLTRLFVDDQDKALAFYTEVVGLVKKADLPIGPFRWLTLVSPEEPEGTELLLERNDVPGAKTSQEALFQHGIPATTFALADLQQEYDRLTRLRVVWIREPRQVGPAMVAVFDDTCGNLIQLAQV